MRQHPSIYFWLPCAADDPTARRQQYLNDLRRILAPSYRNDTTRLSATDKTFEDWQEQTENFLPISKPCRRTRSFPIRWKA